MGKRKRLESDTELLDRLEQASKTTRLYGVIDYGIRKDFYRTLLNYPVEERLDNFFQIGQALSSTMMRAQYAVTERLYNDCLKSLGENESEEIKRLSFEFTRELLDRCVSETRRTQRLTEKDSGRMVALVSGRALPENDGERQAVNSFWGRIYKEAISKARAPKRASSPAKKTAKERLFDLARDAAGGSVKREAFRYGKYTLYPAAVSKQKRVVLDIFGEDQPKNEWRANAFRELGYKCAGFTESDLESAEIRRLIESALSEGG